MEYRLGMHPEKEQELLRPIIIKHLIDKSILVFKEKFREKHLSWNQYQKKHKKDSKFNYRGVKFLKERSFLVKPFSVSRNKLVYGMDPIERDRFCCLFNYNEIPKPIKVLVDANTNCISGAQSEYVFDERNTTFINQKEQRKWKRKNMNQQYS